jgi:hypothetical protein
LSENYVLEFISISEGQRTKDEGQKIKKDELKTHPSSICPPP